MCLVANRCFQLFEFSIERIDFLKLLNYLINVKIIAYFDVDELIENDWLRWGGLNNICVEVIANEKILILLLCATEYFVCIFCFFVEINTIFMVKH